MKLLICDDSIMIRRLIEKFVTVKFPQVQIVGTAENGLVAVDMFKKHMPDIVTTDITMPELDGISALTQMLRIKPDAKIVVVSALSGADNVKKAIDAGAVNFITKPFNEVDFQKVLSDVMN